MIEDPTSEFATFMAEARNPVPAETPPEPPVPDRDQNGLVQPSRRDCPKCGFRFGFQGAPTYEFDRWVGGRLLWTCRVCSFRIDAPPLDAR